MLAPNASCARPSSSTRPPAWSSWRRFISVPPGRPKVLMPPRGAANAVSVGASFQQLQAARRVGLQRHLAQVTVLRLDVQRQIGLGQHAGRVVGPFGNLQAGAREDVAKTGGIPLARVAEAVEI